MAINKKTTKKKPAPVKAKAKPAQKKPASKTVAVKAKPALNAAKPAAKEGTKKQQPKIPASAAAATPAQKRGLPLKKQGSVEDGKNPPPAKTETVATKPEPKQANLPLETDEFSRSDEDKSDGSIITTAADAIKKMIKKGKDRGYVTLDEINAALPQDKINSDLIEDTMAMLSEMGIGVTEGDEEEAPKAEKEGEEGEEGEEKEKPAEEESGNVNEDLGRTDDPVRLYLREMGSVELLSREGEIAIAKRIEAGREMMIGGICESPLTIQAILGWHDALNEGKMLLRDIIDLEATYGGAPTSEAEMLSEPEVAPKEEEEKPEEEGEGGFDDEEQENLSLPRRKWSKPTFASSSRSPRNTPTAACSSST
jgi:hypothetical protein